VTVLLPKSELRQIPASTIPPAADAVNATLAGRSLPLAAEL
jgi:hypothetical protein